MMNILSCLTRLRLVLPLLLLAATTARAADEQKEVRIDDDHPKETISLAFCNIFVSKGETSDDGTAGVTVEIENNDETNVIAIFGHAYSEKALKKLYPKVTFDKIFPGTKGHRTIETYAPVRSVEFISPSDKLKLPELTFKDGEKQTCRLPLYIARYKNKSRKQLLLLEETVVEINIEVTLKPDGDYLRLDSLTNDLIEDIQARVFCTNPRHKPSLSKQEAPYRARKERLKAQADSIYTARNLYASSRSGQLYLALKQRLDSIGFAASERDCGRRHGSRPTPVAGHRCQYCGLSLQDIYLRLDRYYRRIDTSHSNRATVKAAVMPDVEQLYRCCTATDCARHAKAWRSSPLRQKITTCYKRIKQLK